MSRLQPCRSFLNTIRLRIQFGHRDRCAASIFLLGVNAGDERVRRQVFGEAPAQSPGAMAVNDSNAEKIAQSGLINELVHAAGGFFYGTANHVDFLGGWLVAWLRVNRDPAAALRRNGFPIRRTCFVL